MCCQSPRRRLIPVGANAAIVVHHLRVLQGRHLIQHQRPEAAFAAFAHPRYSPQEPQERHRFTFTTEVVTFVLLGHGRDRLGQALDVIGPTLQGQDTKPGSFSATVRVTITD